MSSEPRPAGPDPALASSDPGRRWPPATTAAPQSPCDAEPIHIPGGIQPHGYLLCITDELIVQQVSENVAALTGKPAAGLLGESIELLLGAAGIARLAQAAATAIDQAPLYIGTFDLPARAAPGLPHGSQFDITMHRHDGNLIVELEVARHARADVFASMYPLVRTFARSLQDASTVQELAGLAVREMRAITGLPRRSIELIRRCPAREKACACIGV